MALGYPGLSLPDRLKKLYQGGAGVPGAMPGSPLGMAAPSLAQRLATPRPTALAASQAVAPPPMNQPLPQAVTPRPVHLNTHQIATRTANNDYRRQQQMYGGYVLPALNQLQAQANTNRFSDQERAATLAPNVDALDQQYQQAQGNLSRQLAERGLGDSSAMASGLGALASGEASAHAGLVSNLFQQEQQRQLAAQDALRSYAGGLYGQQNAGAGSLAMQLEQLRLQQQQLNQQNRFDLGGTLMGLGGVAGQLAGAGVF